MFNAHKVPVGRDQIQHLEMTRDIAQRFNSLYGRGTDFFVLPEVQIDDDVATLPGLDGRKMSKSYDNTIPLFEGGAKALRTAVKRIVTDSLEPGQPKDAEGSHLYTLYRAFATPAEARSFREQLESGLGWGDAKELLSDRIEQDLAPMRDRYVDLMAHPERIEDILQAGAGKARSLAQPFIARLREAVGLRTASAPRASLSAVDKKQAVKKARFVSFRDEGGQFRFRLLSGDGQELLLSEAYANPKAAGAAIKSLQELSFDALTTEESGVAVVRIDGQVVSRFDADKRPMVEEAIAELAQAQA
jgi:tryptophanyl-tRNA synthetase